MVKQALVRPNFGIQVDLFFMGIRGRLGSIHENLHVDVGDGLVGLGIDLVNLSAVFIRSAAMLVRVSPTESRVF